MFDKLEKLALIQGHALPPEWNSAFVEDPDFASDELGDWILAESWTDALTTINQPRPEQFPLFALHAEHGWQIAFQRLVGDRVRLHTGTLDFDVAEDEIMRWVSIAFPVSGEFAEILQGSQSSRDIFISSLVKRKRVFVSAIIATVFANILALITSLYSMQIYDRVIPRSGYATLIALTAGAALGLVFDFVLRSTRSLMMEREAARVDEEVSEFFFDRTQSIRLESRPKSVGTMASQLRGIEQIRGLLSSSFLFLIADLPFALFFIFVIYLLGGIIFVVPLIGFPFSIFLAVMFARFIRKDTDRAQVTGNRKNGMLVESLDAAETIKANSGNWFMLSRWNSLVREVHDYEDPIKRTTAIASSIFAAIQQLSYISLIAFGALQVTKGEMTIGALIACGIIAGRVNGPLISMLPQLIVQSGYAKSSLKALDAILALPNEQQNPSHYIRPEKVEFPISAENVSFSYSDDAPVLDVPLLRIGSGERIIVLGGVGSGKTTLLKVLGGLYGLKQGRVLMGGLEISQIAPDILRTHVGYIQQDPRLINGTLRENLILGLTDPGDAAIMAAAEQTGLNRMISGHPRGLAFEIAEGGRGLSGGQRMLTHLTRLLLLDPKVFLLDEPTSNLDQGTEARVLQQIFNALTPDKTLIMVTHKLPLIRLGTRALIMNEGKVIHDGTPENTLKKMQPSSSNPNAAAGKEEARR